MVLRGYNREPCFFAEEDFHCFLHCLEEALTSCGAERAQREEDRRGAADKACQEIGSSI